MSPAPLCSDPISAFFVFVVPLSQLPITAEDSAPLEYELTDGSAALAAAPTALLYALEGLWHRACFKCAGACGQRLTASFASASNKNNYHDDGMTNGRGGECGNANIVYFSHMQQPFCERDYMRAIGRECVVCGEGVRTGGMRFDAGICHASCLCCRVCRRPYSECKEEMFQSQIISSALFCAIHAANPLACCIVCAEPLAIDQVVPGVDGKTSVHVTCQYALEPAPLPPSQTTLEDATLTPPSSLPSSSFPCASAPPRLSLPRPAGTVLFSSCDSCSLPIGAAQTHVSVAGRVLHLLCLRCTTCGAQLDPAVSSSSPASQAAVSGERRSGVYIVENTIMCLEHAKASAAPAPSRPPPRVPLPHLPPSPSSLFPPLTAAPSPVTSTSAATLPLANSIPPSASASSSPSASATPFYEEHSCLGCGGNLTGRKVRITLLCSAHLLLLRAPVSTYPTTRDYTANSFLFHSFSCAILYSGFTDHGLHLVRSSLTDSNGQILQWCRPLLPLRVLRMRLLRNRSTNRKVYAYAF